MANEFQAMRVSLDDLSSRLGKLQQGLIDLNNTVKVISAPPAPPAMTPGAAGSPGATAGPPPSGATADEHPRPPSSYDLVLKRVGIQY